MAKKRKTTSNWYLRRLVRKIGIEANRPKGVKLLDLVLKYLPNTSDADTIFVGKTIHKETNFLEEYKGFKVKSHNGMLDKTAYLCKESNLYYEED